MNDDLIIEIAEALGLDPEDDDMVSLIIEMIEYGGMLF